MALASVKKEEETNPRIFVLKEDKREGKFLVYPLEQGVGHTIGSALRRVLLSQIEGAAITEVRIEGIYHPLATIPNVLEDVTIILLNLKEVAIRPLRPFKKVLTMHLDVQGEGEVVAADIKTPPELEIANPEHHIATLTEAEARLRMDMKVEMGKGFQLASVREAKTQLGFLPLTAIFTPVKKVAYYVEACYFSGWEMEEEKSTGQEYLGELAVITPYRERPNLEKLTLEITTNGAITPSEALGKAFSILSRYFQINPTVEEDENKPIIAVPQGAERNDPVDVKIEPDKEELLSANLEDLDLPIRAVHALLNEGVTTLRELLSLTEKKLLSLRNLGRKSLEQLKERLSEMGFSLAKEEEQ